jgi:hypothetical protein
LAAKHAETVAEAFCQCGLPLNAPLQPLLPVSEDGAEECVLANVCLLTAADKAPECFEVVSTTECSKSASISAGGTKDKDRAATLFLAQRFAARRHCPRPITALRLVDVERGEAPPSGFEPVHRTAGAENCSLGRLQLFVSRGSAGDPRDTSPAASPLGLRCLRAP